MQFLDSLIQKSANKKIRYKNNYEHIKNHIKNSYIIFLLYKNRL